MMYLLLHINYDVRDFSFHQTSGWVPQTESFETDNEKQSIILEIIEIFNIIFYMLVKYIYTWYIKYINDIQRLISPTDFP